MPERNECRRIHDESWQRGLHDDAAIKIDPDSAIIDMDAQTELDTGHQFSLNFKTELNSGEQTQSSLGNINITVLDYGDHVTSNTAEAKPDLTDQFSLNINTELATSGEFSASVKTDEQDYSTGSDIYETQVTEPVYGRPGDLDSAIIDMDAQTELDTGHQFSLNFKTELNSGDQTQSSLGNINKTVLDYGDHVTSNTAEAKPDLTDQFSLNIKTELDSSGEFSASVKTDEQDYSTGSDIYETQVTEPVYGRPGDQIDSAIIDMDAQTELDTGHQFSLNFKTELNSGDQTQSSLGNVNKTVLDYGDHVTSNTAEAKSDLTDQFSLNIKTELDSSGEFSASVKTDEQDYSTGSDIYETQVTEPVYGRPGDQIDSAIIDMDAQTELDTGHQFSLNFKTELNSGDQTQSSLGNVNKTVLDYGDHVTSNTAEAKSDLTDQFSLNIKTELDTSGEFSASVKTEQDYPTGSDIYETRVTQPVYGRPGDVEIKFKPTDEYGSSGIELAYAHRPGSESYENERADNESPHEHQTGPVPVCLIPAPGSHSLLRIDVEDSLHPVQIGPEEPAEDESLFGFGEVADAGNNMNAADMAENNSTQSFDIGDKVKFNSHTEDNWLLTTSSMVQETTVKNNRAYICGICCKVFTEKFHLTRHKRIHTGDKPFKCEQCDKTFSRRETLTKHERVHTGERQFTCDQCDKTFTQGSDVTRHKRRIHLGERLFSCDQCDKTFTLGSDLTRHKRLVHKGEKPFSCDQCEKTFISPSYLAQHKLIHSEERLFACDQCDKTFITQSNLGQHKQIHSELRPFACDQCDKTFTCNYGLTRHKRIHTGERPFACDLCNKTFKRQNALSQHKCIHTGEKPFSCDQCDKSFSRKEGLAKHKLIHTGEKPFGCDY